MLTKKQKELYDFLKDYIKKSGISPSFEEMKTALNLKSKSGIHTLITNLEQRGFIKRLKHKARAMQILKNPQDMNSTNENNINNSMNIPILGSISAGNPIEAISQENDNISVPNDMLSNNYKYFALNVRGDSMIDEGIYNGDIAIIKHSKTINNGKIAAILIKGEEITIKKIKIDNSFATLIPANPSYNEMKYPLDQIEIQGELSGLLRKYN
tara:strand:+ start:12624 stop:13259 length:636 start_codon:yes stop_codon:yes gene_type:complete